MEENPASPQPQSELDTLSKPTWSKLYILIALLVLLLILAGIFLLSNKTPIKNTAQTPPAPTPQESYSNPFDSESQYQNPFSQQESTNPFDALSQ